MIRQLLSVRPTSVDQRNEKIREWTPPKKDAADDIWDRLLNLLLDSAPKESEMRSRLENLKVFQAWFIVCPGQVDRPIMEDIGFLKERLLDHVG